MICAAVSIVCRIKTVNWKNIYLLLFYSLPYFSQEKREVRVRPFNFYSCFSTLTKLLNGWLVLFILKKKTGLRHNVLLVLSFILCPLVYILNSFCVCAEMYIWRFGNEYIVLECWLFTQTGETTVPNLNHFCKNLTFDDTLDYLHSFSRDFLGKN